MNSKVKKEKYSKQFFGWPPTRIKGGQAGITIAGRNPIGWAYGSWIYSLVNRGLFLLGIFLVIQMGHINPQALMELGMLLAGLSLTVYMGLNLVVWYEAVVIFSHDTIKIKPAHSLIWKTYNRRRQHGFGVIGHHKSDWLPPKRRGQSFVLSMDHLDGKVHIATIYSEKKASMALSRLVSVSRFMESKEKLGLDENGDKKADPYLSRPNFSGT